MSKTQKFSETTLIAMRTAHDAGKSYESIAKEFNCHVNTVRKYCKSAHLHVDPEQLKKTKNGVADALEHLIWEILDDAKQTSKLKKLTPGQVPLALAQMIDKVRLLRGEHTSKVSVEDTAADIQQKLKELGGLEEALKKSLIITENKEEN